MIEKSNEDDEGEQDQSGKPAPDSRKEIFVRVHEDISSALKPVL
jgi:hypothetical protein